MCIVSLQAHISLQAVKDNFWDSYDIPKISITATVSSCSVAEPINDDSAVHKHEAKRVKHLVSRESSWRLRNQNQHQHQDLYKINLVLAALTDTHATIQCSVTMSDEARRAKLANTDSICAYLRARRECDQVHVVKSFAVPLQGNAVWTGSLDAIDYYYSLGFLHAEQVYQPVLEIQSSEIVRQATGTEWG